MSDRFVLDAWALVALILNEPAAPAVAAVIADADPGTLWMSAANLGEVWYRVQRSHGNEVSRGGLVLIQSSVIQVVDLDVALAIRAGQLKLDHRLGYMDAICAALAVTKDATVLTGDPGFRRLPEGAPRVQFLPRPA